MSRAQRRASGRNTVCHDCGSHRIASKADYGWLCLPCLDKRNDAFSDLLAKYPAGSVIGQQIDTDGPPMPCGEASCTRDATFIFRIHDGKQERGFTGCVEHAPGAYIAASNYSN